MRIVLCIISAAFGILSMIAAISQIKAKKFSFSHILMVLGSAFLLAAVICNILNRTIDGIAAVIGASMICIAAVYNGLKGGNFHIQHHIIRIALSVLIIIGFFNM